MTRLIPVLIAAIVSLPSHVIAEPLTTLLFPTSDGFEQLGDLLWYTWRVCI